MDYRNRFMINEGLLLLSYAYAVSGYTCAAAVCGAGSAMLAVYFHSEGRLLENGPRILTRVMIQIPFILASGIPGRTGTIVLLAFCNTVVSVLWMESSFRAVKAVMRIILCAYPVFLYLSLIMSERAMRFLYGTSFPQSGVLILVNLIFLPLIYAYVEKLLHRKRKTRSAKVQDDFFTRAYNGSYDGMARKNIY